METLTHETLINSSFEPCPAFAAIAGDGPVCACGWLDVEHEQPIAEVHALPVRRVRRPASNRIAS